MPFQVHDRGLSQISGEMARVVGRPKAATGRVVQGLREADQ